VKLAPTWTPKRKAAWLVILAGVFSGAEAMVSAGIELPGSGSIPPWARGLLIVSITAGAFYFRWRASKETGRAS
jgi:hypothetical protein